MKLNALICGTMDSLAAETASLLEGRGWSVVKFPTGSGKDVFETLTGGLDAIDMLIYFADIHSRFEGSDIHSGLNYDGIVKIYENNGIGLLRAFDLCKEKLAKSEMKRVCLVTGKAASINTSIASEGFETAMPLAAMNNLYKMLGSLHRPDGFTFRIVAADEAIAKEELPRAARNAVAYFLRNRSFDPHSDHRFDEDRLVLRNLRGREIPW